MHPRLTLLLDQGPEAQGARWQVQSRPQPFDDLRDVLNETDATGAGVGLDSYEEDETRRKESADHAGKGDLDDRIGLHRPEGEEDLAKHI